MDFWIQSSEPRFSNLFNEDDETIGDAIQTVFPLVTENAFVVWRSICVPLSYKYDVSLMIADLVVLLNSLMEDVDGDHFVEWPSSTFHAKWDLNWRSDLLYLDSQWISVAGKIENILNDSGGIKISKQQFVFEWSSLLEKVRRALYSCGYKKSNICGIDELSRLCNKIDGYGLLYKAKDDPITSC